MSLGFGTSGHGWYCICLLYVFDANYEKEWVGAIDALCIRVKELLFSVKGGRGGRHLEKKL